MIQLYCNSDTDIWIGEDGVDPLTNDQTGAVINNATCTFIVTDYSGNTIAGPYTLSYVAASSGKYVGVLPHTVSLTLGTRYKVVTTVTSGSYVTVNTEAAIAVNA